MYDAFAERCLQALPELEGTDWQECRRRLSRTYLAINQLRYSRDSLRESPEPITNALDYLRRLVNVMEQHLFSLDPRDAGNDERRRAYGFIASEALDLWCGFARQIMAGTDAETPTDLAYAQVECALLYLASDYHIDAHCAHQSGRAPFLRSQCPESRDIPAITALQEALQSLCSGRISTTPDFPQFDLRAYDMITAARISTMHEISRAVTEYCRWLRGETRDFVAPEILAKVHESLASRSDLGTGALYSDLLHLAVLVESAVLAGSRLAMVHRIPRPQMQSRDETEAYERYMSFRARTRPFLWPSTFDYATRCLPGPHADAVVVVPTGSGKSFLAELACSHAMHSGWVLYLAPTNALVHQVQRDLQRAFAPMETVRILSFIGNQEYTTLQAEQMGAPGRMAVAVMTPEKCAMALRLNPDAFRNCSLCITDEFHLLNDKHRGTVLDLCLARVLTQSQQVRVLLMSAMVENGYDLCAWISRLRDGANVPLIDLPWRPCRTMRSLLLVDRDASVPPYDAARDRLNTMPAWRTSEQFDAPLGLLSGMLWMWEEGGTPEDYPAVSLPAAFPAIADRGIANILHSRLWKSWKNTAARVVAEKIWEASTSVLCFILSSKHHAFSTAEKSLRPDVSAPLDDFTRSLLQLAEAELGVESRVRVLLSHGVGVHSSAMLSTEQTAVEHAFSTHQVRLLYTTSTLAQGLNLPAEVVVVAGSTLGDSRDRDPVQGADQANATILNAFGRAGRATIANHGLAILVSDRPFFASISEQVNPEVVVRTHRLLSERDSTVTVTSPLAGFFESITVNPEPVLAFTTEELDLVSLLQSDAPEDPEVLRRTYGAYTMGARHQTDAATAAITRVQDVRRALIHDNRMPPEVAAAAARAGLPLLQCWRLWRSLAAEDPRRVQAASNDMRSAFGIFISVMSRLPPGDINPMFPQEVRRMNTVLDQLLAAVENDRFSYTMPWDLPEHWARLWEELGAQLWFFMSGATYSLVAATLLGIRPEVITPSRSKGDAHIPAVFSFIASLVHPLSIYAGTLLALIQELHIDIDTDINFAMLPLCIRNGCNSRSSLGWFRFGYRNRFAAHAFSSAFPVPDEIIEDDDICRWVNATRRDWLRSAPTPNEDATLAAVRAILTAERGAT